MIKILNDTNIFYIENKIKLMLNNIFNPLNLFLGHYHINKDLEEKKSS